MPAGEGKGQPAKPQAPRNHSWTISGHLSCSCSPGVLGHLFTSMESSGCSALVTVTPLWQGGSGGSGPSDALLQPSLCSLLQAAAELSKLHFQHHCSPGSALATSLLLLMPLSSPFPELRGRKRRSREKGKLILTTAASSSSKLLTPLLLGKLTPKSLGVSLSLPRPPRVSLR